MKSLDWRIALRLNEKVMAALLCEWAFWQDSAGCTPHGNAPRACEGMDGRVYDGGEHL